MIELRQPVFEAALEEVYMPTQRYKVRYYNRFNHSDQRTVVPAPLTKEQAEKIAREMQRNHNGLGGGVYEAVPD